MKAIIIALLITFACSTKLSNIVDTETEYGLNIEGVIKCIQEAAPYAKDVMELINLVKEGKYTESVSKVISLVIAGSQVVKRCIEYIKTSNIILRNDMLALAKCLVPYLKSYGLDEKLKEAIKENNKHEISKILSGYFYFVRGNIPDACKKYA